jgi:uncharacterized membrane protein YozB (DUF420 family)
MPAKTLWSLAAASSLAVALYAFHYLLPDPFVPPNIAANPMTPRWLIMHAGFAGLALLVGPLQLLRRFRRRPVVHRWLGRIYVASCMIGGLAGLLLAPGSSAGPVARSGFAVLALLWLASTFAGWRFARGRQWREHRAWMIRSFSLTFAAVTLRVYMIVASLAGLPMLDSYRAIAWLCWIPNLLAAEIYLRSGLPGRRGRARPADRAAAAAPPGAREAFQ